MSLEQSETLKKELTSLLEEKYDLFNQPAFIAEDPVSIPHFFAKKADIEISGFLTALIAWGRRASIIDNATKLMTRMDMAPYDFVMNADERELARLHGFVHRTFNANDARGMIMALRRVYAESEGLEGIFSKVMTDRDVNVFPAILNARRELLKAPDILPRTHKHLANPSTGSSAKRINMFLRWMVRQDNRGVDFGLWKGIRPSQLVCPLDVHTGNVARKLGLLTRKQNDWKAALELTGKLKVFDSNDPVRFDFSLFGLGVVEGMK